MTKIPKYVILNSKDVRDILYYNTEQYQKELDLHWQEQQKLVKQYIGEKDVYIGHFFKNETVIKDELQILLQYLALKEGANFVQFKNGKYGFVGYYNTKETAFWLE